MLFCHFTCCQRRYTQPVRTLAKLGFTPNCLTSLQLGADDYLIAAGGQEKEIHLSYHAPSSSKSRPNSTSETQRKTRVVWEFEDHLTGSINNSVLLTSLNLTRSNESSVEPRVGISNNDGTIRLYDVPLRVQNSRRKLKEVGVVELDVPINHCECFFCSICFLLLSGFFLLALKNAICLSIKHPEQ